MPKQNATIHVKRERGRLVVIGYAQTPRGQKFISNRVVLECRSTRDPNFKAQVSAAVKAISPEGPSDTQYPLDLDSTRQ